MRLALIWGALISIGAVFPVASCGESTSNSGPGGDPSIAGDGGDSAGDAIGQGGMSGRGGMPVVGGSDGGAGGPGSGGGVGGALAGTGGREATSGAGGALAESGSGGDSGATMSGAGGQATGGSGGESGGPGSNLPPQCTNGQKDEGEVCVDCGGPCPACDLTWKCSDAECEGAASGCVGTGLCPGGPKPAECLHGTSCDSLNIVPASYIFGVKNGCSPNQDECRMYECRCSCPG
jgi:hypothetical protein